MLHYVLAAFLFAIGEFQLSTMKKNQDRGQGKKEGNDQDQVQLCKKLLNSLALGEIAKLHGVTTCTVQNALAKQN